MLINAFEFAKQSLEIHDKIPLLCIPELKQVLFSEPLEQDSVTYSLRGERGADGRFGLRLGIKGWLQLTCQRCLGPMDYNIASESWFVLVSSEAELPEDETDDEVDYLVASDELDVEALVREEILLAMPLAPKHDEGPCADTLEKRVSHKGNPFKVLEGLKGKKPD